MSSTTNVTTFYHPGREAVIRGKGDRIEEIDGKIYVAVQWYDPMLQCMVETLVHHST